MYFDLARQGKHKQDAQDCLCCIHQERIVDPNSYIDLVREKKVQDDQSKPGTDQKKAAIKCFFGNGLPVFISQNKKEAAQKHDVETERQAREFVLFSEKWK